MKNKLYLIETVSIHRMRYVVEADCEESAREFYRELDMSDKGPQEFSQKHITETISSVRNVTKTEYLDLFVLDNNYLSSWAPSVKLNLINRRPVIEETGMASEEICDSRFMLPLSNYLLEDSAPIEGVLPWSHKSTATADGYSFSIEDEPFQIPNRDVLL